MAFQVLGHHRPKFSVSLGGDPEHASRRRRRRVGSGDHRAGSQRHGLTLRSEGFSCQRARKDTAQIRPDRRLVLSPIIPPVVQLRLFGLALDPEVKDLRVGIVDESRTAESRELALGVIASVLVAFSAWMLRGPDELESSPYSVTRGSISASSYPAGTEFLA